jgi:hypothetical protein
MPTIKQAQDLGARHAREDITRHARSSQENYAELKADFALYGKRNFIKHTKHQVMTSPRCKVLALPTQELVDAYAHGYAQAAVACLEEIFFRRDN